MLKKMLQLDLSCSSSCKFEGQEPRHLEMSCAQQHVLCPNPSPDMLQIGESLPVTPFAQVEARRQAQQNHNSHGPQQQSSWPWHVKHNRLSISANEYADAFLSKDSATCPSPESMMMQLIKTLQTPAVESISTNDVTKIN